MVIRLSHSSKGFTLLELLIVISIIGILVTIAAASYQSSQIKARNSRRMGDMKSIQNAAEQYYADNTSSYPATTDDFGTYLPSGYPSDPKPAPYTQYTTLYVVSPVGCKTVNHDCTTYCACAKLEGSFGNYTPNAGTPDCTPANGTWGTSGTYYCVKNLQ